MAHALWIETNTTGKARQAHEVKVFYGEYATNERDEVSKWYSDVKDFTLWLTAPGKEKVKLTTTPGSNFYSATFTPEGNGIYVISVVHEAKELGGTTKYEFSSLANVAVGPIKTVDLAAIPNNLKIAVAEAKNYKLNAPVQLKAVLNNKPLANKPVTVFSPAGWTKEFTTDENGAITFTPAWPGRYVLEVSHNEKTTGDHYGKSFTATWQGATSSFEVNK
ncbi:hypothetical protein GCM10023149_18730 [Mucilaginibacter gynuensis]|uniref:GH25 family protein n=2 Tax=Mucilaginibacter gynuensis TaxID=1302236 RepID=A0ABP8G9Q5_9SPHI